MSSGLYRTVIILAAVVTWPTVACQAENETGIWAGFFVGPSTSSGVTGASFNVQYRANLFRFRFVSTTDRVSGNSDSFFPTFPRVTEELSAYSLMYGRATRAGSPHLHVAVGVSYARIVRRVQLGLLQSDNETVRNAVGLPMEVSMYFRMGDVLGLGVTLLGEVNSHLSTVGIGFGVQLGGF